LPLLRALHLGKYDSGIRRNLLKAINLKNYVLVSTCSDHVNLAILKMKENGELEELIDKWWNEGQCSGDEDDDDDDSGDVDEVKVEFSKT
jgi:hypothetical protein